MARIIAYPEVVPSVDDYLVGTQKTTSGNQTNPTKNFTVKDVVTAGLGYTVYTALLTQAGTAAPVATILKNNTGATFTWARTSSGTYTITASSNVFTSNKTLIFINKGEISSTYVYVTWTRTSDTVITITLGGDGRITNGSFEIRVYS
ncbi:MAG: hypothetical protein CBC27_08180 [Opitutia bacterium TMED67]|nr:MAG: hypothetical protein CBC27_08180 [Opitutae bacterium TMED67]